MEQSGHHDQRLLNPLCSENFLYVSRADIFCPMRFCRSYCKTFEYVANQEQHAAGPGYQVILSHTSCLPSVVCNKSSSRLWGPSGESILVPRVLFCCSIIRRLLMFVREAIRPGCVDSVRKIDQACAHGFDNGLSMPTNACIKKTCN